MPSNAVMFALYHRDVHGGSGQVVDVSLFESLFSLLGPLAALNTPTLGRVRDAQRQPLEERRAARLLPHERRPLDRGERLDAEDGGALPPQLRAGTTCSTTRGSRPTRRASAHSARTRRRRSARRIAARTLAENVQIIAANELTAAPVQTVADIENDAHWQRGTSSRRCPTAPASVRMHNVVPRFSADAGRNQVARRRAGRAQQRVYRQELGLSCDEVKQLTDDGVI